MFILFGKNLDKRILSIISNIGEKTLDALLLFKHSEDYVLLVSIRLFD